MSTINTASLPDMAANCKIMFLKGYDNVPQVILGSGIYKQIPWEKNTGDTMEVSRIDGEKFASKRVEGGRLQDRRFQQGYTKTMYLYEYAFKVGITKQFKRRANGADKLSLAEDLMRVGSTPIDRRELELTQRISNAGSTTFVNKDGETIDNTTGDGLAILSASHTLKGTSDTYNNIVTGNPRCSQGSLETALSIGSQNAKNQFGEVVGIEYTDIFYAKQNYTNDRIIKQFLNSTGDVDAAHQGITNVYRGTLRSHPLPYLATTVNGVFDSTKIEYWGIFSKEYTPFRFSTEVDLEYNTWEDKERGIMYSAAETSFGHCVVDGLGFIMSLAT